jgi:hypothetical protein
MIKFILTQVVLRIEMSKLKKMKMEKMECISVRGELLILNPHLINQVSIAPVVLYIELILLKF